MKIDRDLADLVFRGLFCLIFIGLGFEHLFADALIQKLMPEWVPMKRFVSIFCGVWLVVWGGLIFIGWQVRQAAVALGLFVIVVTCVVHLPGVMSVSAQVPAEYDWLWVILQRSNLAKNLCLLGICFHLIYHDLGRYSLEKYKESGKS